MPDEIEPMIKIGNVTPPQYLNDQGKWELVRGSGGSYRMQTQTKVSRSPFSGSATMTKEFTEVMSFFVISNDGDTDLTFTVNDGEGAGDTYKVYAGAVWGDDLPPFTSVTITTTVPFQAYAKLATGTIVVVPTPDTTAPDNVTELTTSSLTATSVALTWISSASEDCVGYDIYRGPTLLATVAGTSYNASGLTQATQYTFTVKAKDAANNIATGTATTLTTSSSSDTTPPIDVTNLTTANITQSGLTLNWTASVSGDVASYDIYNGSTFLANVTATTYNVNGLSASTAYTFLVKAKDASGNAAAGTSVGATTSTPADTTPPTVTPSVAAGTYTSSQSVSLSANETATIYYTTDGSTPTTSSTQYSTAISITATTTLKFFGKDTAGNSSTMQSVTYTINITDTTPPAAPTGLSSGTPTSSSVPLSWTISSSGDVTAQKIEYSTDGANFTVFSSSVNPSSTSTTVTGLAAATAYTFRVSAIDGAANQSTSNPTTTATTAAASGKVNDASLILYQDTPTLNQTISSPDTYFQTNTQWTAFATIKPVLNSNAATKIFSRQTPNAILFEFTYDNHFKCAIYGHATNGTGSAQFPAALDSATRTDLSGYYHVVIVRDTTKIYLYVNDTMVNSANVASDMYIDSSTAPLLFGSNTQTSPPIVKNMGYYNRALTTGELTQNYNALK